MQLPQSKVRQTYIDQIKIIEANLKDATSGEINETLLSQVQKRIDTLAERYQYSDELGTARYKLYELQALVHYFNGNDDDALDFINQAMEVRGDTYARAEKIKAQLLAKDEPRHGGQLHHKTSDEPPLQLQALIRGQRSSAIIMAILSVLSVYFIPWAIFYIVLAVKLKPQQVPSRGLIKAAAIATLPLCLGIIPIIIDIEFWKMNKKLREYDELGAKAFISDKEYSAAEPKRKRSRVIAWSILLSIIGIIIIFILVAVVTNSSNSTTNKGSFLNSEKPTPYTSSEFNFVVSFPGFPTTEHSSVDVKGVAVPYTYYSKDIDNGSKSYAVQVAQYSKSGFNASGQERGVLDGAINGMAQSSSTKLVTSSNNGTFLGYPSAEAIFSVTDSGQTYDMYTTNFIKGNDMYVLLTIGENKSSYDSFVGSFHFN